MSENTEDFRVTIFGQEILAAVIEFIKTNYRPDEIYTYTRLTEWLAENLIRPTPGEVFSAEEMDAWALANGYVKATGHD